MNLQSLCLWNGCFEDGDRVCDYSVSCRLQSSFGASRCWQIASEVESVCCQFVIEWGQDGIYMQWFNWLSEIANLLPSAYAETHINYLHSESDQHLTALLRSLAQADCKMSAVCLHSSIRRSYLQTCKLLATSTQKNSITRQPLIFLLFFLQCDCRISLT